MEKREGGTVKAFPNTLEQRDENQPRGLQAATFYLSLLFVSGIHTGIEFQHHQLSFLGKRMDIIIYFCVWQLLHGDN